MSDYPLTGWPTISGKPPRHHYGIFPHTVLDTTHPRWRRHRERLLTTGVTGEDTAGREHVTLYTGEEHQRVNGGKSSFDPVLADVMIKWYAPHGGHVYDPFAGGITRGALAAHHDMTYTGIDLSQQQVDANHQQAQDLGLTGVQWLVGDSTQYAPDRQADMILTCPPYHNLERYSDDPADLSVMGWEEHLDALAQVAARCYQTLRDDRFLVWVTGDLRDHHGAERLLPEHTHLILRDAGFTPANTHHLVNPVGTRYLLARKQWTVGRAALRLDQRVIVMVKGDRKAAAAAINTAYREHHAAAGTRDEGTHPPSSY